MFLSVGFSLLKFHNKPVRSPKLVSLCIVVNIGVVNIGFALVVAVDGKEEVGVVNGNVFAAEVLVANVVIVEAMLVNVIIVDKVLGIVDCVDGVVVIIPIDNDTEELVELAKVVVVAMDVVDNAAVFIVNVEKVVC